jgi:hypothetical protein
MSDNEGTGRNGNESRSRRELLGLAGLGAAGLVGGAALSRADRAEAADGSNLVIGQVNSGTSKTELDTSGTITGDGAFKVVAANADYGVIGSAKTVGAFGSAAVGVLGDGAVGGLFSGTDAAINLDPRGAVGPPGGTNFKGDMAVDSDGVLWLCVSDGTPGTWIKVSHGGSRLLDSPQRAYDSRVTLGRKLRQQETISVQITGVGGVPGVPANAIGIVGNLTVTETEGFGYVVAYPDLTTRPGTSNINWWQTGLTIANSLTVRLGSNGHIAVFTEATVGTNAPTTHVIVDVAAYIL